MKRILIIDDEVQVRTVLREIIRRAGYIVTEASDGEEGLEACRENPVDLVITDIVMPRKWGVETIMEMRIEFPDVKIIASSGGGRFDPKTYLTVADGFGADCALAKPIGREEILEAISSLIGQPTS